jgi:hypothetical protein
MCYGVCANVEEPVRRKLAEFVHAEDPVRLPCLIEVFNFDTLECRVALAVCERLQEIVDRVINGQPGVPAPV